MSWVSSLRVWARILLIGLSCTLTVAARTDGRSFFHRHFAFLPRFLDDADEHVFQRETAFPHTDDVHAVRFQLLPVCPFAGCGIVLGDDVQALAEQRHAPAFGVALQEIHRALRLIDDELEQMARSARS